MKRPNEHLTDAAGKRILRDALEPLGWTLNETKDDYGIDFDAEVFSGGESTGITFKIQLKSSESVKYSGDGHFASISLPRQSLRYLACELMTPTVIAIADVSTRRLMWLAPQLDDDLATRLSAPTTETLTVRVPTSRDLPRHAPLLVGDIVKAAIRIATRAIAEAPSTDFLSMMTGGPDGQRRSSEFLRKAELLKLQQAQSRLLDGDIAGAMPLIDAVRTDTSASVDGRFAAELAHYLAKRSLAGSSAPMSTRVALAEESVSRIAALVRRGHSHLKLFAIIRKATIQLELLAEEGWGLAFNSRIQDQVDDPFWDYSIRFALARNFSACSRKYRQLIRLTSLAIRSPHVRTVSGAIADIPGVLVRLVSQLDAAGLVEAADSFRSSGLDWCKLALRLSSGDPNIVKSVLVSATLLGRTTESAPAQWARDTAASLRDDRLRIEAEQLVTDVALRRTVVETRPRSIAEEFEVQRQIYTSMAESVGIALSDPADRIAVLVRIGLQDLDPSRVLKKCEHIFITLGPQGLPAQWLGLHSAASKTLNCLIHDFGVGSLTLDQAYASMKARRCDTCPEQTPRPASWTYSYEWQHAQNLLHGERFKDGICSGLYPGRPGEPAAAAPNSGQQPG